MDPKIQQVNVFNLPLPLVLGFDYSGTVAAVGSGAQQKVKVGSEVFGNTIRGGCFGEYAVVNAEDVYLRGAIPEDEAGAYGIAYRSAYEPMEVTAHLSQHKGKTIYIPGGAGGVGHFAVQMAKLWGLTVISSGGKVQSLDLLRKMGVDHVIDYSQQDVVKEVLKLTNGQGVDFVYDSTYQASSYRQSAQVVKSGGQWIRLGPWSHTPDSEAEVTELVKGRGAELVIGDLGRYNFDPAYQARKGELAQSMVDAVTWYESGKVRPVITATVPFEAKALQSALDDFLSGKNNVGKVVGEGEGLNFHPHLGRD